MNNKEEIIKFICEAKQSTYAKKLEKIIDNIPHDPNYIYESNGFKDTNTCLGSDQIIGEEIVWQGDTPIWGINYNGRVVDDEFQLSFLLEALRRVDANMPYRGPRYLELGEFTYKCRVEGEFDWFVGCEKILYKGKKVYEAMFQGGEIKANK